MFIEQIKEDIKLIQEQYSANNPLLKKDEYAFNYWVLTKLFSIDEEIVDLYITEYSDDGCDCFVYFNESKELYIIQNKYYGDNTPLDEKYVLKEFLNRPLSVLDHNAYKRSAELQKIFNKNKADDEFQIHLHLYITNNNVSNSIKNAFAKYKYSSTDLKCYVDANVFTLDDISHLYYEDRKTEIKSYKCVFKSVNDGTTLTIDKKSYNLPGLIDAKYILTPVTLIYEIVKDANNKGYSLFEENIREYLGNKGVNARISATLNNPNERNFFFYYNNGITVICDSVDKVSITGDLKYRKGFETHNPQIVNGCQTVNTIYETLDNYPEDSIKKEFENTFVMVKLLVLDKDKGANSQLYKDIVKYNNSQNAITEKDFAANKRELLNLQADLKKYGFLLSIKQSDAFQFKEKEKFNDYRPLVAKYANLYGLKFSNLDSITIKLEKLLQVILAFTKNGYVAFTRKQDLLKNDSLINKDVLEFIKNGPFTHEDIINLYLIYLKADSDKKKSADNRSPIPYYLIGFLGNDICKTNDDAEIRKYFRFLYSSSKETFEKLYNYYSALTESYSLAYKNQTNIEYNQMIKSQIDYNILGIASPFAMINQSDKTLIEQFVHHQLP